MSISGWFKGGAERRAAVLIQARVNREPLGPGALGEVDPALISALGRVLAGPDPRRARAAVEVLALSGSPDAVEPLVGALECEDVWFRGAISHAIQQLDAPLARLGPFATHSSAHVRAGILPSLARLPDGPAWVARALHDPAPEVRITALLLYCDDDLDPLEPLLSDPDLTVRARACDALARGVARSRATLRPGVLDTLISLLAAPGPTGEAAARLLGLAPVERAREALLNAGDRGNLEALRALGRMGGARAADVLLRALGRPGCAGVAAEALAELGDPMAIPAIEAALAQIPVEDDPPDTPSDRSAALKAIAVLRRAARP